MTDDANEYQNPPASSEAIPLVSVVIPAHNESGRIQTAIRSVLEEFDALSRPVEVIVVDDGSLDTTRTEAMEMAEEQPERVQVVALGENHGKGFAIRAGFLHSRGDAVGFIDADLEYPVQALPIMANIIFNAPSVCAIASRVIDDRRRLERWTSQMAHRVAAAVLQLPIRDTQAGIKMFPGSFARTVLTECGQEGWLYDIEALLRAVERRLDIVEVPVMQRSVRRRRASLWAMLSCGPSLLSMAVTHWQTLRRDRNGEFQQVARFGLVGLVNTLVDIAAYWGLVHLWSPHRNGVQGGLEALIAWLIASLVGYALHSRFTFRRHLSRSGFYVVTGLGVTIQVITTGLVTQWFGASESIIGKLLGILMASMVTYAGYRYIARRSGDVKPFASLVRQANMPPVISQKPRMP